MVYLWSLLEGYFFIMVDFLDMFEVVWRGEGGFKDVVVVDFRFEVVEDFFVFDNVVVFGG